MIQLLSEETIDKIAAGEVIERPASIVKELLENAIDAGSSAVTVEIKDGGLSLIRVTDNGNGIPANEIRTAFLRHATSKITSADDLTYVSTLGFRGEALSSIAAVGQVELMTKTSDSHLGSRYVIEGGKEIELTDIGLPVGTTIIVKNIFFNTPARRKFLKSPQTEMSYVSNVVTHLALANPGISIQFISNGTVKFHTSGRGDLKEIIYHIYGREVSSEVIPIDLSNEGMHLTGMLGKPVLNRATRNFETIFVNSRFIKSQLISKAVEEGYREYLMQHKFPFFVINLSLDTSLVDVNVHPTKQEVRFSDEDKITDFITGAINSTLKVNEMINEVVVAPEGGFEEPIIPRTEPFEEKRIKLSDTAIGEEIRRVLGEGIKAPEPPKPHDNIIKAKEAIVVTPVTQMELFEDKLLSKKVMEEYRVIGQLFGTYWLIECKDRMMIVDQHAAHEKVKYESLMKQFAEKNIITQPLVPPIVLNITSAEYNTILKNVSYFTSLGFEIDDFGSETIAIRAIPMELTGSNTKEIFLDCLDELCERGAGITPTGIRDRIATAACKAAVKGNSIMSIQEFESLIADLLELENPYNCPHGRPTIITMSRQELERRFKRII